MPLTPADVQALILALRQQGLIIIPAHFLQPHIREGGITHREIQRLEAKIKKINGKGAAVCNDVPAPLVAGSDGSPGTSNLAARCDHEHPVPVADPVTVFGSVNNQGDASQLSRADHQHRLEVQVEESDVLVSSRPTLNFLGAGVSVSDNPGQDQTDILITGAAADTSAVLGFGSGDLTPTTVARFLSPWWSDDLAQIVPIQYRLPRDGVLRNLHVRQNVPSAAATTITYTVRINNIATALVVSMAANAVDDSNLIDMIAVNAGDLIDVQVDKSAVTSPNVLDVAVSLEFTP